MRSGRKLLGLVVVVLAAAGLGWGIYQRVQGAGKGKGKRRGNPRAVPVEVAPIVRGPIQARRTFSGAIEATAQFVVAPKVAGRVVRVLADLGDVVTRGQVVAELDDDEYVQAVAQAQADLAVRKAALGEAKSALEVATRELKRIEGLRKRGVAPESQRDVADADRLAKKARVEVAKAWVRRAEASLKVAGIRQGYTKVAASWTGGSEKRVVAERFVDEGHTVSANASLLSIVELDPVLAVITVTERDYPSLKVGQPATLTTDAYSGETFKGTIRRIAPVFRIATRQARVEITVVNPKQRLRPGMFARVEVVLKRVSQAIVVPARALTARKDHHGVFVVDPEGRTVRWCPIRVGVREGERVQVVGDGLTGRVVTLGQQLLEDGSQVVLPSAGAAAPRDVRGK